MARITVEDCLENVENRFELVMVGSKRARQIAIEGRTALLPEENDKPTVIALREIAQGLVDASILSPVEQDFAIAETIEEFQVDEDKIGGVIEDSEESSNPLTEVVEDIPGESNASDSEIENVPSVE